ncbi:type IV secretion protein Rhs [Burkholderia aenigmatica]|uniref:type VI secretion system Vgr family protein n=1 Tax=Burkholderia cepacia complex TaxID=87882 RepID=UPI000F0967F0|nr:MULTISPECIES: type VI secretion system Vgr family protein [Burkholderia cepacia complex]AYQ38089.1 type VI secretion system tip protein VgrG [Burkholderia lata]VWC59247.1 type IV secretion protein Rhs [Burkholderia aenigmatica]
MDLVAALTGYGQATRHIQIDTAMPGAFVVERFHGREGINESFRFEIDVLSSEPFLDLSPLIGSAARLRLATGAGERCWNGYVTHAAYAESDGEFTRYRLTMESWLALLQLRRNCLYFVDLDVEGICERVFGDYPEAHRRYERMEPLRTFRLRGQYRETDLDFVLRQLSEAALSFRIEHEQDAGQAPSGDHTVVVFDRHARLPDGSRIAFNAQDVGDPDGVMTQFTDRRQLVPDRVVATSWKASELHALAGQAQQPADAHAPVLPVREIYDGQRAGRFDTSGDAQRYAEQRLDALQLAKRIHHGAGTSRTLETGKVHTLTDYMGGTVRFVPLSIEHEAVNNLGAQIGELFGRGELENGLYRNRFVAVPEGTPIVPPFRDRPTVHGVQTAIVVGEPGGRVSSTRDHQVRIQFPWMRGTAPLRGGLTDTASRSNPAGHAPGNHRSGILARVAEQAAGPNFGHAFTPRVGTEVVIGFESGNIDSPVVLGQVYGGQVRPPFAAGEGSDANHSGTLTGLQTQTLDGQPGSRWVMDDAAGQLRHELNNSTAGTRLAQGYLIDQQGTMRGAYRGEGFELATQGWGVVRAGAGVLVSSTARALGASTQMDVAERVEQLKDAAKTAQELDKAATGAQAVGLEANAAQSDFLKAIDPAQDGKFTGSVSGQSATKPNGTQRDGGDPVERFAVPAILMESPENIVVTTPDSAVSYAAQHVHLTSQGDAHVGAGATVAAATGDVMSLYSVAGGLKAIAGEGPVSVAAHASTMEILGDQTVRVTSTDERVDVLAQDAIVLQQGPNRITLKGGDIIVETPGQFAVKSGGHPFPGPRATSVKLPALPVLPQGDPCDFLVQALAASPAGRGAVGAGVSAAGAAASATASMPGAAVSGWGGAAAATQALASASKQPISTPALPSQPASQTGSTVTKAPAAPGDPTATKTSIDPASANSAQSQGPELGRSAPVPPSGELDGAPKSGAAGSGGPCNLHIPPLKQLEYQPDMGVVDYYQTDAQGKPVLANDKKILLRHTGSTGMYDIEYTPATATLTATVRLRVVLMDQHEYKNGKLLVDKKTGLPVSVPYDGDGPGDAAVVWQAVERPASSANLAGFKQRIENGLNRNHYYMQPKACPLGKNCTCKVKLKQEIEFVTTSGRFHRTISLFPMEARANSENWGEVQVTWDRKKKKATPDVTQNAIIHEAGHHYGWPDEYFEDQGTVYSGYINSQKLVDVKMPQLADNWQRTSDTNLMGEGMFLAKPEIPKYYMYGFRDWFQKKTNIEWEVLK